MEAFLIRLLIGIGVIWLTEFVMTTIGIKEPARKLITMVVVIVAILFIAFGTRYLPL